MNLIESKVCTKCGVEKSFIEFVKQKNGKYGVSGECKLCKSLRTKIYYEENRERINNRINEYNKNNRDKKRAQSKNHYENNKEKLLKQKAEWKRNNSERVKINNVIYEEKNKERINDRRKDYYKKNKNIILVRSKTYRDKNRDVIYLRYKTKIENNENLKLARVLRCRILRAIKSQYSEKAFGSIELLGCDIETARQHLENQFTEGMTWEKFGKYGIHIDHIRPCASFDLTDPEQQKACFHYTNLQPLWAFDNLSKGAKII